MRSLSWIKDLLSSTNKRHSKKPVQNKRTVDKTGSAGHSAAQRRPGGQKLAVAKADSVSQPRPQQAVKAIVRPQNHSKSTQMATPPPTPPLTASTPQTSHEAFLSEKEVLLKELSELQKKLDAQVKENQRLLALYAREAVKVASELKSLETELEAFRHAEEAANLRATVLNAWCDPTLLKFEVTTPAKFVANTRAKVQQMLTKKESDFEDLLDRAHFPRPELWALYWVIAHASREAAKAAENTTENGASTKFAEALMARAHKMNEAGVSDVFEVLRVDRIYDNKAPDVREVHVGADLLLILAGEHLVGSAGIKLIWLQAKAGSTRKMSLNYWRDVRTKGDQEDDDAHEASIAAARATGNGDEVPVKEPSGLRQVNALLSVNQPENGSFGAYLKYLPGPKLCAVMPVKAIPTPFGTIKTECNLGIEPFSARAQEALCALVGASKEQAFPTAEEAASFILKCALQPVQVCSVVPKDDGRAWELVMSLKQKYVAARQDDASDAPAAPAKNRPTYKG